MSTDDLFRPDYCGPGIAGVDEVGRGPLAGDVVAAAKRENRPLQLGNYSAGYQLVAAWLGTASGLPVTHSHVWFVDSLENHERMSPWAREALDYSGRSPFGGG